mmetsp:Transcript_7713/g.22850  ORF Transcript_7713/g.22850 Transcript_7713/m.22850 type:complete len:229 (-) Transcript_7713:1242-1928(-)
MGLLTIIRKAKRKEREMRILMVGLDNAGKTTIVKRINGEDISEISPTLGFNIKTMVHNGFTLNIWDVGGQKTIRAYWRNYFESTDGLIWVIDSADRARMELCAQELHVLLKEERLMAASLLIFANKQDVPGALTVPQISEVLRLPDFSNRNAHIEACSAVSGAGLREGMDWIVEDIKDRMYFFVPPGNPKGQRAIGAPHDTGAPVVQPALRQGPNCAKWCTEPPHASC